MMRRTNMTFGYVHITIFAPDDRSMVFTSGGSAKSEDSGVITLPVAGTYTLVFTPDARRLPPRAA
jgi:hypothetical protein